MFQFIRRVSGSFFPRPDRPWRDDATSHAPTIGRKRTYSVMGQDEADSPAVTKRTKTDPDAECDSASEGESPRADTIAPVDGQEVKEVTKGVKQVDLDDGSQVEDASSIRPEGVPLPDSLSGSPSPESPEPEPEPAEPDVDEEAEHAGDKDSVASSAPEDDAKEEAEDSGGAEEEEETPPAADKTTLAREVIIIPVEAGLHEAPETLEIKA